MRITTVRQPRRLISLTPLIDVVFILLVFFMISSNFSRWHLLPLNSSDNKPRKSHSLQKSIVITVHESDFTINKQHMSFVELQSRIRQKIRDSENVKILIQTDQNVSLQRLVTVLNKLDRFGAKQVTLIQ